MSSRAVQTWIARLRVGDAEKSFWFGTVTTLAKAPRHEVEVAVLQAFEKLMPASSPFAVALLELVPGVIIVERFEEEAEHGRPHPSES